MIRQFLIDNILITYEKTKSRYPQITTRCISEDELTDKFKILYFGSRDKDHNIISKIINFDINVEELLKVQGTDC